MRTLHLTNNPAITHLSDIWLFRAIKKNAVKPLRVALESLFYLAGFAAFGFLAWIFINGFPLPLLIAWLAIIVMVLFFPRIFIGILLFLNILIIFWLMFYIVNSLITEGF